MTSQGKSGLNEPLNQQKHLTVQNIYKLQPEQLVELFKKENLEKSENSTIKTKSLELLRDYRFGQGVLKSLQTEAEVTFSYVNQTFQSGIIGDKGDIKRRTQFFGANTKPLPQIPPLIESIKEALDNRILLYLAIAALFTVITGTISEGFSGAVQGISIYIAIFLIVAITSLNDWIKDKNFVRLQSELKNEVIAVIRGKHGATQTVNIYDLQVGDVILLETGCRVPADCLLIEGIDVKVDESYYNENIRSAVTKTVANEANIYSNPDPFLLANTLVAAGSGKAVVCAVGARSRRGIVEEQLDTSSSTPLQVKLQNLGGIFSLWGIYAAGLILLANLVNFIIKVSVSADYRSKPGQIIDDLANYFTLSITVIIVAVPEGLPLAVVLSLAYSVLRMKDDGVLVRNLNSPEVMGKVEEICTGKTGTLTTGDMKVAQFYAQSLLIRNSRKNTLFNCELFPEAIELLQESILYNCDARIEMDDKAFFVPVGNPTEVGLIKFLQDAEIPVHDVIREKLGRIEAVVPFSTIRKRSVTAVRHPIKDDTVRIYVKGAPEFIVPKCSRTFEVDGRVVPMTDEQLNYILQDILHQKFTTQGLRCLAFAYKDISVSQFEDMKQSYNNFQSEEDRNALESQLTFIGVLALQDDLRDKVLRSVQFARRGHINVRLVSGDNVETAIATAVKAGIITEEESRQNNVCMSGEEFRQKVGGVVKNVDGEYTLERKNEFQHVAKTLKVLGRANPLDKHILTTGLKEIGKVVSVTGEGINDVDALRNSHVGFAMGSGVSVAKDSADMVLTNDDFESTMMAVMWGRNIYSNVRKFLQFQVTANFTALIIIFIGAVTKGTATFGVVQLLWLNLIMDTFAAIALGSERPHPSIIKTPPVKENETIMTVTMWRQIYGVSIYITFVMVILFFFVDNMWDLDYAITDGDYVNGVPTNKNIVYTILFNTFIYLHLFNEINCRKVGATEFNVFHNIFTNWYFILIVLGLMVLQYFFVNWGSTMTRCAPLDAQQHAFSIVIGSTVLLVGAIFKLTPPELTNKLPIVVDENKGVDENNKIMAMYNKQANAKVTKSKVQDDVVEGSA